MPLQNEVGKFEGIGTAIYEEFNTAMLLNRNYIMRDRSLPLLEKGGAFIAVGALPRCTVPRRRLHRHPGRIAIGLERS
jgi:hypothetical protein